MSNVLFNISESLREDTSLIFLNQPPMHKGDSCCDEELDDSDLEPNPYPGEPFINKLQRIYKAKGSVPMELLETLTSEGMKQIIEILINDNLNLRKMKNDRKSIGSSDSESGDYRFSNTHSLNSFSKQQTFPISLPIAREELKMRRNNNLSTYQKIETIPHNPETFIISPISVKMQSGQYDQLILKLIHEITEETHKKSVISQVIRLSQGKIKLCSKSSSFLQILNKNQHKFSSLIKDLGKLKIFSQIFAFQSKKERKNFGKKLEIKEEHRNIIKTLISNYDLKNLKNFREYAYGLMENYEASEITLMLINYVCISEINIFGQQVLQNALKKQILENQEKIDQVLSKKNQEKREKIKIFVNEIKGTKKS